MPVGGTELGLKSGLIDRNSRPNPPFAALSAKVCCADNAGVRGMRKLHSGMPAIRKASSQKSSLPGAAQNSACQAISFFCNGALSLIARYLCPACGFHVAGTNQNDCQRLLGGRRTNTGDLAAFAQLVPVDHLGGVTHHGSDGKSADHPVKFQTNQVRWADQ